MNDALVKILREMAVYHEMAEEPFKPRAYENAANSIESLDDDVRTIYKKDCLKGLEALEGIGKGIAEKIEEFIKKRTIKEYKAYRKKWPVDLEHLTKIEGVGPKTIKKLYEEFHIKTATQLEKAARSGKLSTVSGFGEKTQEKILKSLAFLKKSHGRYLLGDLMPIARGIIDRLRDLPNVKKAEYAGSLRRMQETIGDLDILVVSDKPEQVIEAFLKMPEVADIIARGATKTSVRLSLGINADVRIVPSESFGAAMQYFTGDKYHNIEVRKIAIEKGYKLNEYGLFKGPKSVAGHTEQDIYAKLGMAWMEPELRTNTGEIEAALAGNLPHLIGYDDLKGDLQTQTDWTDGEDSILQMAEAAKQRGLEYIAITDHTKSLAMTGGSDEHKLKRQMAEIDHIQTKITGFKILKGAEVNILKDGSLDINDETLAQLDVVGASIHSLFSMSEADMTARIIRAMENPHVDIIFHPTGRVLQKREPYKVNIDELIKTAKRTGTILEINAQPERLDLKDDHIRKAVEAGLRFSIDSDAHTTYNFDYLEFGIGQARRGWVTKKDVINTRSWQEMLKLLK